MVTTHETQQVLPPTSRDFEVFRRVRIERQSTREAAEEAKVSQTRVRQILERVEAFLQDVAKLEGTDEQRRCQLYVAELIAGERVDDMYGKMRRSLESAELGQEQPKFAIAASRIAIYRTKLPDSTTLLCGGCDYDEEEEIPEAKPAVEVIVVPAADADREVAKKPVQKEVPQIKDPPIRACSPETSNTAGMAQALAALLAATPVANTVSEEPASAAEEPKLPLPAPAQPIDFASELFDDRSPMKGGQKLSKKERRAQRRNFLRGEAG